MPRVVHFDISADDPQRAIRFFASVFGWQAEQWQGPTEYWLIRTGDPDQPGIDGGLAKRERPSDSVTNFIDVPSVDEYVRRVEDHGGEILQPKTPIPGVGYLAAFKDTEGNIFGMMERAEAAQ